MSEAAVAQRELALRVLGLLDLTSLDERDTPDRIERLCAAARSPWGFAAAVCVYPEHVTTACRSLRGTPVRIATVINFPDGGCDPARVERETQRALSAGAGEIDLVLPYRALLQGDAAMACAVVEACRSVCGAGVTLKLIIESGELGDVERIREACAIGLECGVDFLKTSTGKAAVNATPQAAEVMLDAIGASGGRCGFKAAGGIRTLADAKVYIDLADARLGAAWVAPAHLRIGASSLFAEIESVLAFPGAAA